MISRRPFLVDTGSDLCVFTRKLIPRRRELVNYDLYAAKGTTIPTHEGHMTHLWTGQRCRRRSISRRIHRLATSIR
jgi:hypothetical protein